ncbi:MAG TPA: hypothetical protein PKO15_06650 [Fibrobacteria bacterium]|nr:hypothetical protein [Fibrobacteria bacterium]
MNGHKTLPGLAATLLLFACGQDDRLAGGTGSETTNTIQVSVVDAHGRPVANAHVLRRDDDDTSTTAPLEALTDEAGVVRLGESARHVWIEVRSGDTAGAFQSLSGGTSRAAKVVVSPLSELVVSGLRPGTSASLPGLGRRLQAGADGTIRFRGLPPGAARIRCEGFDGPVALPAGNQGRIEVADQSIETTWPADGSLDSLALRRFLDLSGLAHVPTDSVTSMIRGRRARLDLAGRGLQEIQPALGSLNFLLELNLSGNRLRTLPGNIGALKTIDVLDLSRNPLDSLPGAVRGMDSLRILDLDSCGLGKLPEWLGDLGRLWYLDVAYNRLDSLPRNLVKLRRLATLGMFQNRIRALPDGFHHLDSLAELWAETNGLASLPDSFERLPSLRILQLDKNPLVALPDSLGSMASLSDLRLSSSSLSRLPASMARLPLKHLEIYGLSLCPMDPPLADKLDSLVGTSWRQNLRSSCP